MTATAVAIAAEVRASGSTLLQVHFPSKLVFKRIHFQFANSSSSNVLKQIPLMFYYGTGRERKFLRDYLMDEVKAGRQVVVITSYDILRRDKDQLIVSQNFT